MPQNDGYALFQSLRRLLQDQQLREQLTIKARQRVEQEFSVKRATQHLRQIFASVKTNRWPDPASEDGSRDSQLVEIG